MAVLVCSSPAENVEPATYDRSASLTKRVRLREICFSRSGDKGSDVNIGIAVYDPQHYLWIRDHVTEQVVEDYLSVVNAGKVSRYELPKIGALNFLVHGGLAGGASKSLMVDGHGKSFSSILLDLELDAPPVAQ